MIYFSELCFYLNCIFGKLDWMNCRKKMRPHFQWIVFLFDWTLVQKCDLRLQMLPKDFASTSLCSHSVFIETLTVFLILRQLNQKKLFTGFWWECTSWVCLIGRMCSWCVGSPMWFDRNQRSALIWKESTDHEEVKLDMVVSVGCLLEVDQRGQGRLM